MIREEWVGDRRGGRDRDRDRERERGESGDASRSKERYRSSFLFVWISPLFVRNTLLRYGEMEKGTGDRERERREREEMEREERNKQTLSPPFFFPPFSNDSHRERTCIKHTAHALQIVIIAHVPHKRSALKRQP